MAVVVAAVLAHRAEAMDPSPYGWILQYDSTNSVVWDPHWPALAAETTPRFDLGPGVHNRRLIDHFDAGMGGPPDPVRTIDDRYLVLGACVPHDCEDKSFLWIDPVTHTSIGAIAGVSFFPMTPPFHASLVLFSRSVDCRAVPSAFDTALETWIKDNEMKVDHISFVGRDGRLDEACRARR
jgi:hypothetical protein